MDIRAKPASGKKHVLTYEAFKKYCEYCPFCMKIETQPQVVIVECNLERCIWLKQEEIWRETEKEVKA